MRSFSIPISSFDKNALVICSDPLGLLPAAFLSCLFFSFCADIARFCAKVWSRLVSNAESFFGLFLALLSFKSAINLLAADLFI